MSKSPRAALLAAASIGAALLLAAGTAIAQDQSQDRSQDPGAPWAEMQRCGAIANDDQRHACMDDVLRKAGALASPEARAAEHRKAFGVEVPKFRAAPPPAPPAAESEASASPQPRSSARPAPPTAAVQDQDRIAVTLQDVVLRGDGKLALTTSDGAVWDQADADAVMPRPVTGQTMQIERTALGGYLCHTTRWTAFRCLREP